jgi:uncharacterized protein YlxW (UPF0749 family)
MRPNSFRVVRWAFLPLVLCLSALALAAPSKPTPQAKDAKTEQLVRRIGELEQARKDDAKALQETIEKLRDKIDARLDKHEASVGEKAKQDIERVKEWVGVADKRVEWAIYLHTWISSGIIGIMTLIAALVVYKSSRDAQEAKKEARELLNETKGDVDDKLRDIKTKVESAEKLLDELTKTVNTAKDEYQNLSIARQKSLSPEKPLEQSDIKAVEVVAAQDDDPVAKHRAEAFRAQNNKDWIMAVKAWDEVLKLEPDSTQALFGRAFSTNERAVTEANPNTKKDMLRKADDDYGKVVSNDPMHSVAFNNWGNVLNTLADPTLTSNPDERRKLAEKAIEKYRKAIELKADYPHAFNGWGNALNTLAEPTITSDPDERRKLANEAIKKFEKAIELKADDPYPYNGWGNTLNRLADPTLTSNPDERRKLAEKAIDKYRKAIELKADYPYAYNGWGNALNTMTDKDISPDPERRRRLAEEAISEFNKAIDLNRHNPYPYNGLGKALNTLSKPSITPALDDQRAYALRAISAFEKSIELLPANPYPHNNCGASYLNIAVADSINRDLAGYKFNIDKAKQYFSEAERIMPGVGSLNLMRIAALNDDQEECRNWLTIYARNNKPINCCKLREEKDFIRMRETSWFQEFMEKHCRDE